VTLNYQGFNNVFFAVTPTLKGTTQQNERRATIQTAFGLSEDRPAPVTAAKGPSLPINGNGNDRLTKDSWVRSAARP